MAVHPFARKCEALIADLIAMRDSMRRAKDAAKNASEPAERKIGKLSDIPLIWLLPPPDMHKQPVSVNPGYKSKVQMTEAGRDAKQRLISAERNCANRRAAAGTVTPGHWLQTPGRPVWVGTTVKLADIPCPDVKAARDAFDELWRSGRAFERQG